MSQPEFQDILYRKQDGIATVTINRPQVYNAFRPLTIDELLAAFEDAWYDESIGVIVLGGAGGNFCTGGDQKIRGDEGYVDHRGDVPRLQVRHLHRMIREVPKPVIARVQDDGTCWLSGTTWHGMAAMRVSVSNWSTTEADIDRSAGAILRASE